MQVENQDIAGGAPIRAIIGGPAGGGDSNRAQKARAREARNTSGVFVVDLASGP